ncbi:MAG: site-specific DNA-methyltransferase [Planctomycetaceae bacterium]
MSHLTPAEKQDVIRFLEADQPLPDKYRFLLFDDKREVELVWNGKSSEVCNIVLPFQVIEQVDEPRAERLKEQPSLFNMDERGRQLTGWTNKLIWGDNKLVLSSLKNGPLREEIDAQGGIKLIYIDPPFDVGADFSMDIEIGDDTFTKEPNVLEEIAYRDTWGRGADSFISMIYERLILMRDLLAEDGSIYVHIGPTVNHLVRAVLDEVFGVSNFTNEIVWRRAFGHSDSTRYGVIHDAILFYSKSSKRTWNAVLQPADKDYIDTFFDEFDEERRERYQRLSLSAGGLSGGGYRYVYKGVSAHWRCPIETLKKHDAEGRLHWPKKQGGVPRLKKYESEHEGVPLQDIWTDISKIHNQSAELTGYSTQKPEALIRRILSASSNENDIVADFFCGSGTTAAVAEKLNRKWICSDLGKFAVHTTRKRLIGVQRERKAEDKTYRAFEILNLGKYERQHFVGVNPNLREEEQAQQLAAKEAAFLDLILKAYQAEKTDGLRVFHGKKAGRMVVVGPVNLPVTRLFVEEIILECRQKRITKVDLLGFEFEMGLFPNVLDEAKSKGIDIAPKYIPAEVFDKRAVEKNQVVFHDVAFIEVKPLVKGKTVAVQLTDFSVFYSQGRADEVAAALKEKSSKIVVEKGQIVKIVKDKKGVVTRQKLTKHWTDWIDYWSVDFDFENKREIIRVPRQLSPDEQGALPGMGPAQQNLAVWEEQWTGEYIFENEWQSFRTKQDRSLELTSAYREVADKKRVKIAVKVVDIFGNDTMTIVDVSVGGRK